MVLPSIGDALSHPPPPPVSHPNSCTERQTHQRRVVYIEESTTAALIFEWRLYSHCLSVCLPTRAFWQELWPSTTRDEWDREREGDAANWDVQKKRINNINETVFFPSTYANIDTRCGGDTATAPTPMWRLWQHVLVGRRRSGWLTPTTPTHIHIDAEFISFVDWNIYLQSRTWYSQSQALSSAIPSCCEWCGLHGTVMDSVLLLSVAEERERESKANQFHHHHHHQPTLKPARGGKVLKSSCGHVNNCMQHKHWQRICTLIYIKGCK